MSKKPAVIAAAMAFAMSAGSAHAVATGVDVSPLDRLVKEVDLAALIETLDGNTDSLDAASAVFRRVLRPYFNAVGDAQRQRVLARIAFHCDEDLTDPTGGAAPLAFPFELLPQQPGAAVWHRYRCRFVLHQDGLADYWSPVYHLNQLDIDYAALRIEPAVAFQNYKLGNDAAPDYAWMGRYVQPLNRMLRDRDDAMPADAIAGINGGYDYRVDAWEQHVPHDNICLARYALKDDRRGFYSHPNPAPCPMDGNALPECLVDGRLPYSDDLGDALVYLPASLRARSWRTTPLQSPNCGGLGEAFARGALLLYGDHAEARRTLPSIDDVASLAAADGTAADAALGAGPLLIRDGHFVYDEGQSEEGMPIDNYEVGGASGAAYETRANAHGVLHLVNVDGLDNEAGLHDWMLGLYFLSPYVHADSAVALGNGGDATLWINPALSAVAAVINDVSQPNRVYFTRLFDASSNPGVVSNCSGFDTAAIRCGARPVHDGLFAYRR